MRLAPDGSPVELYRRLPERTTEAQLINTLLPLRSNILDLGCGTGRLAEPLRRAGHRVVGVDNEPAMIAELRLTEGLTAEIESLNLGPRFDAVLLMSHFVNVADDKRAKQFLDAVRRHLKPGGMAIVERHAPGWVSTCTEGTKERDGVTYSLTIHERSGNVLDVTVRYEFDDARAEQRFQVREVGDITMEELAVQSGLRMVSILDETGTLVALCRTSDRVL